jgi:hypothetical protein
MKYPGMGDPYKKKKTIRFLVISAIIAVSIGLGSTVCNYSSINRIREYCYSKSIKSR